MTMFYQVPYRTTAKHYGMWWLPGLGEEGAMMQPSIETLPTSGLAASLAEKVKAIKADMSAGKLVFVPRETESGLKFTAWVFLYLGPDEALKMLDPMLGVALLAPELYDASGVVVSVPPELRAGHPVTKELWAAYEDGINRCKLMREEQGVLLLEPDKNLKAFLDWWRMIDPATLAANLAMNESDAAAKVSVPLGLYNYWATNPSATSVPGGLLARSGLPWTYILLFGAAAGAGYYLLRKSKRTRTQTARRSMPATVRQRRVTRNPSARADRSAKAYLSRLRGNEEIDAWGLARAVSDLSPIRAEQILNELVRKGELYQAGNWYGRSS